MSKTHLAPFAQTPKTASAVATTAAASYDGDTPANTVLLLTAGSDGAILTRLTAIPRETVTASALYLWISNDSGTTKRLVSSALMPAYTLATTTQNAPTKFTDISEYTPLRLAAGDKLYVGTLVTLAAGIVFNAEYTDF